ncbi:hypothetical protein J2S49_001783 [Arcanobacterium wilhelmae]|uniref:CDP-glycerol glycerophosphotransferase, TagB/SpsB family n=1 Tax=Arcanobacterium wilhelmae TaxID=1803177 RepID=A0ABT9NDH0_9ACTO|nr:CDP-glycerol glycerophosphotransferase family protein [Arcanobacterium wilhelmae]MDP9801707.1 hypothetical protein [Arcanobacterium wilhelmae]
MSEVFFVDLVEVAAGNWAIHVVTPQPPSECELGIDGVFAPLTDFCVASAGRFRALGGAGAVNSALLVVPGNSSTLQLRISGSHDVGRLELRGAAAMSSRRFAYKRIGGRVIAKTNPTTLTFSSGTRAAVLASLRWNTALAASVVKRALPARIFFYRVLAPLARVLHQRTWLISDSPNKAGDNGEALFRHLAAHPSPDVVPVFAIANAAERARLAEFGKVVDPASLPGKFAALGARVVASSQAGPYVIDPLGDHGVYRDLYPWRFVFLQHGVLFHDLSAVLGRYVKRIDLVVASGDAEARALASSYGYQPGQVALTGMPRMDRLENRAERVVLVAPTWRTNLAGVCADEFRSSQYCQFWNAFLSDRALLAGLREAGYRIEFLLHPSLANYTHEFSGNDVVTVSTPPHDYPGAFECCALLVTDYSSVAYDVAYLDKPVVYAQFDVEAFYEGQTYERGDDDTRETGFGPVAGTLEETRDAVLAMIGEDALPTLGDEFRARRDAAFAHVDRNNSARVVKSIRSMLSD